MWINKFITIILDSIYTDNLLKLKRESEIHKINTDEETIDNLEEITLKNIRLFKGFTFARNPNERLPSKLLLRRHLWLREIQLHWKEAWLIWRS